jgi:hypothetical protein
VRQLQNHVIRKLPRPPSSFVLAFPEQLRPWYLAKFDPELGSYTASSDVWLRYHGEGDVRRWGDFVAEILPSAVSRIATT